MVSSILTQYFLSFAGTPSVPELGIQMPAGGWLWRCMRRYEWEKAESKKHEEKEKERAEEREQMAMIDWHEFVVTESARDCT